MLETYVRPRLLGDGEPGFVPGKRTHALVRMPERAYEPLPNDGAMVPLDEYWQRRILHGDVRESDPPAADEPATAATAAAGEAASAAAPSPTLSTAAKAAKPKES